MLLHERHVLVRCCVDQHLRLLLLENPAHPRLVADVCDQRLDLEVRPELSEPPITLEERGLGALD